MNDQVVRVTEEGGRRVSFTTYTKQRPEYVSSKIAHMRRTGVATAGYSERNPGAACPNYPESRRAA